MEHPAGWFGRTAADDGPATAEQAAPQSADEWPRASNTRFTGRASWLRVLSRSCLQRGTPSTPPVSFCAAALGAGTFPRAHFVPAAGQVHTLPRPNGRASLIHFHTCRDWTSFGIGYSVHDQHQQITAQVHGHKAANNQHRRQCPLKRSSRGRVHASANEQQTTSRARGLTRCDSSILCRSPTIRPVSCYTLQRRCALPLPRTGCHDCWAHFKGSAEQRRLHKLDIRPWPGPDRQSRLPELAHLSLPIRVRLHGKETARAQCP